MNDRTFVATGGGGGIDFKMYRRTPNGAIELFDVDRNDYRPVPKGAQGRFELHGWSPFYQTQSTFDGKIKTVTRTRAEYKILKFPRDKSLEGFLFDQQFPVPKNIDDPRSKLGQFIAALLDIPAIPAGMEIDIDAYLSTVFVASTTRDETTDSQGNQRIYCGVSWDTIDPTKTVISPHVTGNGTAPAPEPALVGAAVGGDDAENVFETEDDL